MLRSARYATTNKQAATEPHVELTSSLPVLGVGFDVGGWLGKKQAVAVVEGDGQRRVWHGSATAFTVAKLAAAPHGGSPLDLVRLAWPKAPGDLLERYRVVIGIDAPLGFPQTFAQLVAGGQVTLEGQTKEIDSPLAYRECERIVHRTYGKKPLSAVFDKLGNNATVGIVHARRWRDTHGFRVLPFQEGGNGNRMIIEVYPALVKRGPSATPGIAKLLPSQLMVGTDEYDAAICSVLALSHGLAGRDPELPTLNGPSPEMDASKVQSEGWIYAPPSEWVRAV